MGTTDAITTAAAIRAGEVSAREVCEAAIARIEKLDPELNAMVGTRFEQALAEVGAGLPDGPLTGVPTVIKNLGADVAGLPTTNGSRLFADFLPAADSELVRRYRAAGMVVLGTTNCPELGLNASTESALLGPARNPWQPQHSTGGSSGGSAAAVASGMVAVAHGNDGGGSIRIPAAMCGLFGLKPSRGRVSSAPEPGTLARPVSINHALTTTVRDSALLLDIAAGGLPGEAIGVPGPAGTFLAAAGRDPGRLRIGLVTELRNGPPCDPVVVAAATRMADLCESLGHTVEPIAAPFDMTEAAKASAVAFGANLVLSVQERLAQLDRDLREDDLEPFTRFLYEQYQQLRGVDVTRGMRDAQTIGWEVGRAFVDHDVLLTPTLTAPVPALGVLDTTSVEAMYTHGVRFSGWTSIFNLTGMPAMSIPFGTDPDGLPVGVQFAADLGREELLLSLAGQLEQAAPWPPTAPGYPD
ncbi:MAG: amidase [Jatrophihabitans sp.]|nr:MAG: amidase [Jatrophihabitans sp.]